jgi:hypothetical protein
VAFEPREERRQTRGGDAHRRVGCAVVQENGVAVVVEQPAAGKDDVADVS